MSPAFFHADKARASSKNRESVDTVTGLAGITPR